MNATQPVVYAVHFDAVPMRAASGLNGKLCQDRRVSHWFGVSGESCFTSERRG